MKMSAAQISSPFLWYHNFPQLGSRGAHKDGQAAIIGEALLKFPLRVRR
jgi:hypothetical protein